MKKIPNYSTAPQKPSAGFTLLEVLIAVVILGLSITAILQQFSLALRGGSAAQDMSRAVLYAKQKLEELKTADEVAIGSESGSFEDGFLWETSIEPYPLPEPEGMAIAEQLRHELVQLTARVIWQSGVQQKRVELSTLKLVRKKEWETS
ncbi:MAG: prepilin-type N-terminal cleavage/methylation domain-containing protein [Desulfobacterota bacterium]|nr:prepilin-type N-terminal cleavage/methylation domain-containing protein [Thermodesulfobacteriota bacterium]